MKNKSSAVIGLGFGDCGKGITTDFLCSQTPNPLVVRYCSGQQCGHTVMRSKDFSHVFSNFGSGTLRSVPTYWSKYCTIDPIGITNELKSLLSKNVYPFIFIDERCPVTTPYDMAFNQCDKHNIDCGTCGVGVGATIEREENHYHLTFGDLFIPSVFKIKLEMIRQYYQKKHNAIGTISLERFMECVEMIKSQNNIIRKCYDIPSNTKYNLIFEGGQGLLLDQNIGFFPHVTRANTGTTNILDMGKKPELYLVTRAYQTRHGNGIMTNEELPHNIKANPYESNVKNKYQGDFRISLLDLDLLLYGMSKDQYIRTSSDKTLVITCLDNIQDEYRFVHNGRIQYRNDEKSFVHAVATRLGFTKTIISKSPFSEQMEHFKL